VVGEPAELVAVQHFVVPLDGACRALGGENGPEYPVPVLDESSQLRDAVARVAVELSARLGWSQGFEERADVMSPESIVRQLFKFGRYFGQVFPDLVGFGFWPLFSRQGCLACCDLEPELPLPALLGRGPGSRPALERLLTRCHDF